MVFLSWGRFWDRQGDCWYLFDSAFFVVVTRLPTLTLLSDVVFYHIFKLFFPAKVLKLGLNSRGIQSAPLLFWGFRLERSYISVKHSRVLLKKVITNGSHLCHEQKPSNFESERAQCIGTLRGWTF